MEGFRLKKNLIILPIIVLGLIAVIVSASTAAPSSSTVAPLQPINIFETYANGQWIGSGDGKTIEIDNYNLPIDSSQSHNGLPSLRINTSGDQGWWLTILAGGSWESYSIAPYVANGALEFNIKGDIGGEDFTVAVSDVLFERNPKYCEPNKLPLSNYVTVSTSWQHVSIPLSDLIGDGSCEMSTTETLEYAGGTFDPTQIYAIVFNGDTPGDMQVWVNDIEWTSTDFEPVFPPIKVNQVGYTPDSPKYALVSGFSDVMLAYAGDQFFVRDISNGSIVFTGALSLLTNNDGATGEKVLKADFSTFTTPGSYYITLQGYENSAVFTIAESAFDSLVIDSARYFYLQRQGIALDAANAGVWAHGVGHPQDNAAIYESDTSQTRDVMKGWYDAGDYGKYVNAGATAVSDLLWAYELFPAEFPDSHLNLPESGNGVPDILDEARWELEWMLKMQDSDGGFYHMVKSKGADGSGEWDSDTTPDLSPDIRFIRESDVPGYGTRTDVKPTSVTASGVAGLAHAAVVFAPIDAAFSAELLTAAELGWTYLTNNPNYITTIKGAPYTIPYEDYSPPGATLDADHDDRVWAAATLFRATGNTTYRTYFDQNYGVMNTKFLATDENAYGVGNVEIPAILAYMAATNTTPAVMSDISADFNTWRTHMINRANNATWQTTLLDADYYWGSNYPNLTTPMALAIGSHLLGSYDADIVNLSRKSLSYVLGVNSLQFSYVSGFGENALERPFSMMYNFDNKPGVPAGIMVGGANEYNNSFLYSNYSQKKYQDNAAAWSTNEHTVYWNAVLVFHAALAAHEADTSIPPTPTPTPSPTMTATPSPTTEPTMTATPSPTPSPTMTATPSPTTEPTMTATPSPTTEPTMTATPSPTTEPTMTATPGSGSSVESLAYDETLVAGSQTNDYEATWEDDWVLQIICERQSKGNPSQRYDYVEHIWLFDVEAGDSVTFTGMVWETSVNSEDQFSLHYSTDGVTYIEMMTIEDTGRASQDFALPNDFTGTLYVKLLDSDQTPGNNSTECVSVEHLKVQSVTTSAPTAVTVQAQHAQGMYVMLIGMLLAAGLLAVVAVRTVRQSGSQVE